MVSAVLSYFIVVSQLSPPTAANDVAADAASATNSSLLHLYNASEEITP